MEKEVYSLLVNFWKHLKVSWQLEVSICDLGKQTRQKSLNPQQCLFGNAVSKLESRTTSYAGSTLHMRNHYQPLFPEGAWSMAGVQGHLHPDVGSLTISGSICMARRERRK